MKFFEVEMIGLRSAVLAGESPGKDWDVPGAIERVESHMLYTDQADMRALCAS